MQDNQRTTLVYSMLIRMHEKYSVCVCRLILFFAIVYVSISEINRLLKNRSYLKFGRSPNLSFMVEIDPIFS